MGIFDFWKRNNNNNKQTEPTKKKSVMGWADFFGTGPGVDAWRKQHRPTRRKLIDEYKNTVYACIQENTTLVMSATLRAYTKTKLGKQQTKALWPTKRIDYATAERLQTKTNLRLADGEQLVEVVNHPLLTLLDKPNPYMPGKELIERGQLFQELAGAAYWYVRKNVLGVPVEIYPLYSQYVTTVRDEQTGYPLYYLYGSGSRPGSTQRYELEEIIPFVLPGPYDPLNTTQDGFSPLMSVFEQTEIFDFFNATQLALLQNEGRPDGILSFKDGIGENEKNRLRHEWSQMFSRAGAGKVAILDEEGTFTPISYAPSDLSRLKVGDSVTEAICMAYDVPPAIFNKDTGTYASYATACESHIQRAIKPRLERNQSILNMYLVPMFDHADLMLVYDDPSFKNKEQQLTEDQTLVTIGVKTPNEVCRERGLAPKPWGDQPAGMYTQQANNKPNNSAANETTDQPEPAQTPAAGDNADENNKPVESDGGTPSDPAPATGQVEQAQSALMGMVGGVQAALEILAQLDAGTIPRDTAIRLFVLFYHLSPAEAAAIVGPEREPKPIPPQQPIPQPGVSPPAMAPASPENATEIQSDQPAPQKAWPAGGCVGDSCGHGTNTKNIPAAVTVKAHKGQPIPSGKELAGIVRKFFDRQAASVLSHFDKPSASGNGKAHTKKLPERFVNLDDWTADLYRDSLPVIEAYAGDGYKNATDQLLKVGASPDAFNVTNPRLVDGVKKATYRFADSTNKTTSLAINDALKQLREQVSQGLVEEGDSIDQLRKRVNNIFDGAETSRAELIAQSEASRAHHNATRLAAIDSGVAKGFKLMLSSEPCPLCQAVNNTNGEIGLTSGKFNQNNDYDDSMLPIHPNCRCSVEILLDDEHANDGSDGNENDTGGE